MILNGSYDKERGWTSENKDRQKWIAVNEKAEEKVRRMEEGDRTKSNHVPLKVELKEREISVKKVTKQEKTKIIKRNNCLEEE